MMRTIHKISMILLLTSWLPIFFIFVTKMISWDDFTNTLMLISFILWFLGFVVALMLDFNKDFWKSLKELKKQKEEYKLADENLDLMIEAIKRLSLSNMGITNETIELKMKSIKNN